MKTTKKKKQKVGSPPQPEIDIAAGLVCVLGLSGSDESGLPDGKTLTNEPVLICINKSLAKVPK
jgi:hypothetical protein